MEQQMNDEATASRWVEDIVRVLEDLGGVASLEQINQEIPDIRPSLSETWRNTIRRTIQQHSSDSNTKKLNQPDLFFSVGGLGSGVWGLRSLVENTPDAIDVNPKPVISEGTVNPERVVQQSYRILRDTELARQLKLLYRDHCQICETALELAPGRRYSEAHHIKPLGKHHGSDTPGNVLVLCPNHHALCDYGAIKLERDQMNVKDGHNVSSANLEYHNRHIYGQLLL